MRLENSERDKWVSLICCLDKLSPQISLFRISLLSLGLAMATGQITKQLALSLSLLLERQQSLYDLTAQVPQCFTQRLHEIFSR